MLKKKSGSGGRKTSGYKYEERSADSVRKRAEQKGGQFDSIFRDGIDTWRPKEGENIIRILPPTWEEHDHYGYDIWIHGYVGPDKSTYLCPQKMSNDQCPICRAAREAKAAGEEDEAKQLGARRQVAVWIIDRDDDQPLPKLFTMSWSMDRDIAALCHDKKRGRVLLIDHPDEGYDVSFTRTGKGLNTRYIGMAIDREPSPIAADEEEQEKILEFIQEHPIPDVLNFYDVDYLEKVVEGGADERDEDADDEDEDEPASKKKVVSAGKERASPARAGSRRAAPFEDDEDEDEGAPDDDDIEGVDEDDEDEPTPEQLARHRDRAKSAFAKASSGKGKSSRRDEDDEDEDEDELAPKKKVVSTGKGRRPVDEDDEPDDEDLADDEDEDDEDEDEDEPAPKKKGAGGRPALRPVKRTVGKRR